MRLVNDGPHLTTSLRNSTLNAELAEIADNFGNPLRTISSEHHAVSYRAAGHQQSAVIGLPSAIT